MIIFDATFFLYEKNIHVFFDQSIKDNCNVLSNEDNFMHHVYNTYRTY